MIDRPAARHPAHDGNTPVQKRTHMHLPADILIAPDDDSRPVAPQQQHIALTVGAEHIVLKRLIKKRVMRCCFDLNHAEILPFLISFFILSQVSTKNNRKLRARTESLPHWGRWPEGPDEGRGTVSIFGNLKQNTTASTASVCSASLRSQLPRRGNVINLRRFNIS